MNPFRSHMDRFDQAIASLSKLLITMRMAAFVLSIYAMIQGSLIIFGGDDRFSQIGYNVAMMVPGAPESWGVVMGAAGIISFIGVKNRMYKVAAVGMALAGFWSMLFGTAFLISSTQYPEANLTAIAAYGKDAVLFFLMATADRELGRQHMKDDLPDE